MKGLRGVGGRRATITTLAMNAGANFLETSWPAIVRIVPIGTWTVRPARAGLGLMRPGVGRREGIEFMVELPGAYFRVKSGALVLMLLVPFAAISDYIAGRRSSPWTFGQLLQIYWWDALRHWRYPWRYGSIEVDGVMFDARRHYKTGQIQFLSVDFEWHCTSRAVKFTPDNWWVESP